MKKKGRQSSTIRGEHKEIEIEFEEVPIEVFIREHPEFGYGRVKGKK